MEIEVETKQWGNSIGLILPSEIVKNLKLGPNQKIIIRNIEKVENPLKELFGFGKENPITRKEFLKFRKEFKVSKWI